MAMLMTSRDGGGGRVALDGHAVERGEDGVLEDEGLGVGAEARR